MNEPSGQKLTYTELVNILCILSVRLERLENLFINLMESFNQQDEFLTTEVLKARLDLIKKEGKTLYSKRRSKYE